jgi:hypothetical protein
MVNRNNEQIINSVGQLTEKIISHINMENTTLFIYVTGTVF